MNRPEYLFTQLSSECSEVIHRITKILHFGLYEKQEGQTLNNEERFWDEFNDLIGTLAILVDEKMLTDGFSEEKAFAKRERIEKYMIYARSQGTLQD